MIYLALFAGAGKVAGGKTPKMSVLYMTLSNQIVRLK